jgi:uncharacterized glyoxalase superfamily protein PhnB
MEEEIMANDGAKLGSATPIFRVSNLPQALEWYQSVLGFQIAWTWGEPADHASVCRDSAAVNLVVEPGGKLTISRAYFAAQGVEAYYDRVSRAGGRIAVPLGDRPYGMRDFRVVDPSGNELSFGEPTSS